ncbi:MAG: cupin domain-containing protein [Brooklawnia sp.]|jgi:mannose-6-phosphate isomerase-like protein (cupin superfamily)
MIYRTREQMETDHRDNMRGGEGTVTLEHIMAKDELLGHGRLFAFMTVPVDATVGLHQHDNEQEYYLILSGHGRYQHDNDFYDVGPGDLVSVDDHHSHGLVNTGEEPIEAIALILNT